MAIANLTTITPTHVGSGRKLLRGFDFATEQNRLGFIELEKIVGIIGADTIPQLTAVLERRGSIWDFLKKGRAFSNLSLDDISSRISSYKAPQSSANELKEHYHTALRGPCIPGSSLKGAMKTVIWEAQATKEQQKHWNQHDYGKVRDGRIVKFHSNDIDKKLFGPNANEKTTRFLKIGDVHFSEATVTYEVGVYNAGFNNWSFKRGNSFLVECIPSNIQSSFDLTFDRNLFAKNREYYPSKWSNQYTKSLPTDASALCRQLNDYMFRQLKYEQEDLEAYGFSDDQEGETMIREIKRIQTMAQSYMETQARTAVLRIGGNSGWNFTTGGWIKDSSLSDSDYAAMRKSVQRGRTYDEMHTWPKTRKMTMQGIPMGFVKIDFPTDV